MIIINGEFNSLLDISDRSFHYGDACFTTICVKQSRLQLWAKHLERLTNNCQRLGIQFADWSAVLQSAERLIEKSGAESAVVKVVITRGRGGRGYSPKEVRWPSYVVSIHSFPSLYTNWHQNGINVGLSSVKLGKQPLLAGIKHCNRLEQVLIKDALDKTEFDDVLVCDFDDNLVESSAGNLFWLTQGQWYTPSLEYSGVEGVMRNCVLDYFAEKNSPVVQVTQNIGANFAADEMFICNSLMGVVAINTFNDSTRQRVLSFASEQVKLLQMELASC